MVVGFEDVWRPPAGVRSRRAIPVLGRAAAAAAVRLKLSRVVAKTPEVMVKVTGRTGDAGHLAAHLRYITRNGELAAEGRDGLEVSGAREVSELADDWSMAAELDSRRRVSTPFSVSMILSMPADTDAARLLDAARAFAAEQFGERHDYLFALHTDTRHPHVHLTVRALGDHGERLNPKKADLEAWRQAFAEQLCQRGVEAEATPRRARGITRKPERTAIRKIRERHEGGAGTQPKVLRGAYKDAARAAFGGENSPRPWEARLTDAQVRIRRLYLQQAVLLRRSDDPSDRALGDRVVAFVQRMRSPDTQRLALARELRDVNSRQAQVQVETSRGRSR